MHRDILLTCLVDGRTPLTTEGMTSRCYHIEADKVHLDPQLQTVESRLTLETVKTTPDFYP